MSDWLKFVAHYRATEGKGNTYGQSMSAASKLWRDPAVKEEFIASLKENDDETHVAPKHTAAKKSKSKPVAEESDSEEETPPAKPRAKAKKQPVPKVAIKVKPDRDAEYYRLKTKYLKAKYQK